MDSAQTAEPRSPLVSACSNGDSFTTWCVVGPRPRLIARLGARSHSFVETQVNEHPFEDKLLYYRFFVDEDARAKAFWAPPDAATTAAPSPRWRIVPHTACNSRILSIILSDQLAASVSSGDKGGFLVAMKFGRMRAREWAEGTAPWRKSRCVMLDVLVCYSCGL